jgi:hypothetical protein
MRCPLPIDWLEYLEGAHSEALASHLPACLPCQLLVEELRRTPRPRLQPSMPKANVWPCWPEAKPSSPSFGDIWWTTESLGATGKSVTRVLVLLVSDAWEESGRSWCDIVPLSTDIENATSVDLLIQRTDTDLGIPWRMLSRYQTIANIRDLGARIGALTRSGREIVEKALAGHAPEERCGTPIEGPNDMRASLPDHIDSIIRLIGKDYALSIENENVQTRTPRIVSFELHPFMVSQAVTGRSQLAAQSTAREECQWMAHIPDKGYFKGRIEHRLANDELLFVIDDVAHIELVPHSRAWMMLWSRRRTDPVRSQEFVLSVGTRVSLSRDLGIVPSDISRLEVTLSNEC